MKVAMKWFKKYFEIKVDEVNAATAWDLDFKRMKR